MKRNTLTIALLFWALVSFAQHAQVGIKAGINIADLNYDNSSFDPDARVGVHAGLLVHFHLTRNMAVQPEVVYSSQGAEFGDYDLKINYINVPFLFQYMFNSGFRLETGPQVGVLLDAEQEYNDGDDNNVKRSFKKTDLGWAFGVGYLSPTGLGVDARYNLGLTDITKGGGPEVTNRVWQFGIFYQFRR